MDDDTRDLDVITMGRTSVDLYGQQIGSRLEDIASFAKSVGGCPANIAIGTARLGLKSAIVTRVGDEQMGRFVREQFGREGVALEGVATDPERLTALVLLSVEDDRTFPLIFYRENCADMALCEDDVDEALIARTRAVLVTGTHFSRGNTAAAQMKAIRLARGGGARVAFDLDYRPNLWGLAGHAAGESRYVRSAVVTDRLAAVLPLCDLIVGTEEEVHIAAGTEHTLDALRRIRAVSSATIVLKRGPMGCVVFDGPIPDTLEGGIVGQGFPIEVYNVLGAGDAFFSGFLRGWLRGEPHATSATWANACGAFAVSRLLCAPEIPTWDELQYFLEHGSAERALRRDRAINHVHWATTRRPQPPTLMALAIDHRLQLETVADAAGAPRERIADFKALAVDAAAEVAQGRPGFGMLLDSTYGTKAFAKALRQPFWIGRPVEEPGSRPLRFDGMSDLGSHLVEWPATHTVKCLAYLHPDDAPALMAEQEQRLLAVFEACRRVGRECLIEVIAGKNGPLGRDTVADLLGRLYDRGLKPDWWKLEPQADPAAWARIGQVIRARDPWCRGVVLLGLEASESELVEAFRAASSSPIVKGFAVGRTIFADAAERWFRGEIDDGEATDDMARRFGRLVSLWEDAAEGRKAA